MWIPITQIIQESHIYAPMLTDHRVHLAACLRYSAERVTRFKSLQSVLYWLQYLPLVFALGFPLEFYENSLREHKCGLATQTFGPWMGDEVKALLVNLILGALAVVVLFAIVRKLRRAWWIGGSFAPVVLMVIECWTRHR